MLAEYLSLGLLAAAVALVLAGVAGWALARFVFEGRFTLPLLPFAGWARRWWRSPWRSGWPTVAMCSAARRSRCCGE